MNKMIKICFCLPEELNIRMTDMAKKLGMSKSEFIRAAVEAYFRDKQA